MFVNTQFTGTVPANSSHAWFTHSWDPARHVVWYVVPVTPVPGAPQIEWSVSVQRAAADKLTYYVTVRNLTSAPVEVEARYAVLNP